MSLVGTLGKLAVGVLVAKGVGGLLKNKAGKRGGATPMGRDSGGLGSGGPGSGGMGGLLGGSQAGGNQTGAGLNSGQADLGGLLERLGGVATNVPEPTTDNTVRRLDDLLNPATVTQPSTANEDQAALLIRAMLIAARCDGEIDADEKQKITGQLGDISDADRAFVQRELASTPDVDAFIASVPASMTHQVYTLSLMTINLDNRAEAQYLDRLASGLRISHADCNRIHEQLGVPTLFT